MLGSNGIVPLAMKLMVLDQILFGKLKILILFDQNHGHPEGDLSSEGFGSRVGVVVQIDGSGRGCVFSPLFVIPT